MGQAGAGYGAAQPSPGLGGYQAPDQGYYSGAGAPAQGPGGVAGISAGVQSMQLGGGQQPLPAQAQSQARPAAVNQLYPIDLVNSPLNVAELELPPPPILLPPNVSCSFVGCPI